MTLMAHSIRQKSQLTMDQPQPYQDEFQVFSLTMRQRIIEQRKARGLTQEEMQAAGLSLRQYQRIESGETENVTIGSLFRICRVLDMELVELLSP